MQFVSGMLKCFVKGILQGSFEIKNGETVEGTRKIVQGIPGQFGPGRIYGNYDMADYNLVNGLFGNGEEQIWTLAVGERMYEVPGFIEKCGNFPNPRVILCLNGKLKEKQK